MKVLKRASKLVGKAVLSNEIDMLSHPSRVICGRDFSANPIAVLLLQRFLAKILPH